MTDKEFDKLIAAEVAELNDHITRDERMYELEQQVIKMGDIIALHDTERLRWNQVLRLAGAPVGVVDPHTFTLMESQEFLAEDFALEFTARELGRLARLGLDFDNLIKAMEANETLKSQWDQLVMTMKLYHQETKDD